MPKRAINASNSEHDAAVADLVERTLIAPDELSRDIDRVAKSVQQLASGRLKWSTLVTLISDDSKIGKRDVELVLKAAMALNVKHLKPQSK